MGRVTVLGGTFAGVAAATRLARVGHEVTLAEPDDAWADALRAALTGPLAFPAPWRDLFKKTGRPAAGALGLHGLALVPDADGGPTDRGDQWRHDTARLGQAPARAWRDLVDGADAVWQALRPLGLEAELTPAAVARAGLDRRRSLEHVARSLPHPELAGRVRAVARARGLEASDAPAWWVSRLSVERTFGRWRLVGADGRPRATTALVDVLLDRLAARGVRLATGPDAAGAAAASDADATVDTRDPGARFHRPRPWRRHDDFVAQLLARPPLRVPGARARFAASGSSAGGPEPWAQLLSGALAAYAAHEVLTGADIRPTNKAVVPPERR